MKVTVKGLGFFAILAVIGMAAFAVGASVYGLYLAFSASVILGIVILFVEPLPLIIGLVKLFTGLDIARRIVEFFSN